MRAIDNRGDVYLPYSFGDGFTVAERRAIEVAIKPHVAEPVDAMFNNWQFEKYGKDWFTAQRATWDRPDLVAQSAEELAQKITKYYA